jgi:hypothetical protein
VTRRLARANITTPLIARSATASSVRRFAATTRLPYLGTWLTPTDRKGELHPGVPWYDWQAILTITTGVRERAVVVGGINNTRFFASINDRRIRHAQKRRASDVSRLTSTRPSATSSRGQRRSLSQPPRRRHRNNDNAGISPIYTRSLCAGDHDPL